MSLSVPPVTKYFPPGLNAEQRVWSPMRFFSMNLMGVGLQTDRQTETQSRMADSVRMLLKERKE